MSKTKATPQFKPFDSEKVAEGDIIEVCAGMKVYTELPEHFCYENRKGVFDKMGNATVEVGEDFGGMNTAYLIGKYIVTRTAMNGGGTGHGPGDVYPDGWNVTAKMVGRMHQTISFYQSGSFTAMNEKVRVVGRAKQKWEAE